MSVPFAALRCSTECRVSPHSQAVPPSPAALLLFNETKWMCLPCRNTTKQSEMVGNGTVSLAIPRIYGPCLMLECKQTFSYNPARMFIGLCRVGFDSLFNAFLSFSSVAGQIQNLFPSWK